MPPPLFEGLCLDYSITFISGEPYAGKTLLMLAMMLSLDLGRPLAGTFRPTNMRRTLFIGQDAASWHYKYQVKKLLLGHNVSDEQISMLDSDMLLNQGMTLSDKSFLDWLAEWKQATDFEVLMLDSFIDFHNMNENDNSQMRHVMRALKSIRDEFNCAILVAHHRPKPNADSPLSQNFQLRGATSISGSIDAHIYLTKQKSGFRIQVPKNRGLDDVEVDFKYEINSTPNGGIILGPEGDDIDQFLITSVRAASNPMSRADLLAAAQVAYQISETQARGRVDRSLLRLQANNSLVLLNRGLWSAPGKVVNAS